jgi:hypothetical protein
VFLSGARLREVAVVLFYLGIGSSVAELPSDGWTAPVGPGGFFLDNTFVFVTVAGFDHGLIGMIRVGSPLYVLQFAIADKRWVWE